MVYGRLFCFGFFLHNPRWFRIFRLLVRLDRANDHYIIFSQPTEDLYQEQLGIEAERMHFVPPGDWRQTRQPRSRAIGPRPRTTTLHADEATAITRRWWRRSARFPRSCSSCARVRTRKSCRKASLPDKVTIRCDVPVRDFDAYLRRAKAGIIALRHDTGSSGESVALALMRDGKCLLATKAGELDNVLVSVPIEQAA